MGKKRGRPFIIFAMMEERVRKGLRWLIPSCLGLFTVALIWEYVALASGSEFAQAHKPSAYLKSLATVLEFIFAKLGIFAATVSGLGSILWEQIRALILRLISYIKLHQLVAAFRSLFAGIHDVCFAWVAFPKFFEITAMAHAYPWLVRVGCVCLVIASVCLCYHFWMLRKKTTMPPSSAPASLPPTE